MISIIEDICVRKKKWITDDEMMNIVIIAESTPGPVAINCATFVGYKAAGFLGALITTFGVVLPSFAIILPISMFLDNFLEITIIAKAFAGIRIAVGFLILNAAISMIKKLKKNTLSVGILICSVTAMLTIDVFAINFSTILLMLIAGVFGLVAELLTHPQKTEDR